MAAILSRPQCVKYLYFANRYWDKYLYPSVIYKMNILIDVFDAYFWRTNPLLSWQSPRDLRDITINYEADISSLPSNRHASININLDDPFNSLIPGRYGNDFNSKICKFIMRNSRLDTPCKMFSGECHRFSIIRGQHWLRQGLACQILVPGSGNGLVPSGNKPLLEPILIQIYVAIWRHYATMS